MRCLCFAFVGKQDSKEIEGSNLDNNENMKVVGYPERRLAMFVYCQQYKLVTVIKPKRRDDR